MERIPLPETVALVHEEGHEATFEIYPYYPGYGPTVGNALRRVLLSSLPGAAITSVRFEGVQHEFTAIPGVAEDVVSILLNLKRVRLRLHGEVSPVELRLQAEGERTVRAGDIEKTAAAEVVNPGHVIAHLTSPQAKVALTLTVKRGRGYVPVELQDQEERPLGTVAVDAIYTPVERVSFRVENVRVGQATEYHKLILTIRTDGTITPKEALIRAASVLEDHFGALGKDVQERLTYRREALPTEGTAPAVGAGIGLGAPSSVSPEKEHAVTERVVEMPVAGAVRAPEERVRDPKAFPIVDLPVSTRIQNILEKEGIKTVAGLILKTRGQLLAIPGLGEKALEDIEAALARLGDIRLREDRKIV